MAVRIDIQQKTLIATLIGEIDHHSVKEMRLDIDSAISEIVPTKLILDFSQVTFMDSSGIGLVMGRYKMIDEIKGKIIIRNPSMHIKKVMKLSGLDMLATIVSN